MKNILFLAHEGFSPTIFMSQVIEHCRYINGNKLFSANVDLLTYEVFKKQRGISQKNLKNYANEEGMNIVLKNGLNIYYPFSFLLNLFILFKFLLGKKYDVIHARSDYSACIAVLLKPIHKASVVWDCRGDGSAELSMALREKNFFMRCYGVYLLFFYRMILFFVKKYSDRAIFVSEALKLSHNSYNKACYIIPCLVNNEYFYFDPAIRKQYREKYGFTDKSLVLMYSGGLVGYQGVDELDVYLSKMLKKNSNYIACIVTPDAVLAAKLFKNTSKILNRSIFLSLSFNQMNQLYNAVDFGVLLRRSSQVNFVASPTKFGEYCMTGLPVIMNDTVEQSYKIAKQIGNYISYTQNELPYIKINIRSKFSDRAGSFYSRNSYVELYKKIYLE